MASFMEIYSAGLYLTEAFQAKDMLRAVDKIQKYLERATGMKFVYATNEEFKNKYGDTQIGIRYFIGNDLQSVRFNWERGQSSVEISSIDVWDNNSNKNKYYHINTKGISVAKVLPSLAEFIKKPHLDEIQYGSTFDGKKITVNGTTYKSNEDAIEDLAKQGKDANEIADITGIKLSEVQYYMKKSINAVLGDSNEKRISSPDVGAAEKLFKSKYKTFVDSTKTISELEPLVSMVASGFRSSLIVSGVPEANKTYTIKNILSAHGLARNNGYVLIKGNADPMGLMETMFLNRSSVIVFDDMDSIWGNEDSVNMLKAVLDSNKERLVSWKSPALYDAEALGIVAYEDQLAYYRGESVETKTGTITPKKIGMLPNEFIFLGGVIFITNLHQDDLDDAVKNISMTIDVTFSPRDIIGIIANIIPNFEVTVKNQSTKPSKATQLMALDALDEYASGNSDKYISVRTFIGFLTGVYSGAKNWKELALKYFI